MLITVMLITVMLITVMLIITLREDSGVNRDCYLFNPSAVTTEELNMFRFLGKF